MATDKETTFEWTPENVHLRPEARRLWHARDRVKHPVLINPPIFALSGAGLALGIEHSNEFLGWGSGIVLGAVVVKNFFDTFMSIQAAEDHNEFVQEKLGTDTTTFVYLERHIESHGLPLPEPINPLPLT
jgi:hypothetical protein